MLVRRMYVVAAEISEAGSKQEEHQISLFDSFEENIKRQEEVDELLASEQKLQEALVNIKGRYGKNSILKGRDFEEGATARDRNEQIGGHKA